MKTHFWHNHSPCDLYLNCPLLRSSNTKLRANLVVWVNLNKRRERQIRVINLGTSSRCSSEHAPKNLVR
jgi:hypothetical protein